MKNLKILMIILLFASCNSSLDKKKEIDRYNKNGLSFLIPKDWKVEKDREIEGVANSRFITVIKAKPSTSEQFFVITAIDSGITLNAYMDILIKQAEMGYVKRKVDFTLLNEPTESLIGLKKVLSVDFETKVSGNRNNGSLTTFNSAKKTFAFISSAEAKFANEHTAVVDSVIKSLKVK